MGRGMRRTWCMFLAVTTLLSGIELPVRAAEPDGDLYEAAEEIALETAEDETDDKSSSDEASSQTKEQATESETGIITQDESSSEKEAATEEVSAETEGAESEGPSTMQEQPSIEETAGAQETISSEQPATTIEESSNENTEMTEDSSTTEESVSEEETVETETLPSTEAIRQEETEALETEEEETALHVFANAESDTIARGIYNNIYWEIGRDGKLYVHGSGEYCEYPQHASSPWYDYREFIKTAEIDVKFIENLSYMFEDCVNLTSVDFSKLYTGMCTDLTAMFAGCKSLTSVDLSNIETSGVTKLNSMFQDCSSLEELDLSNFNTGKVTEMEYMFASAESLKHIRFGKNFTTLNVLYSSYMFQGCRSLEELDLSGFYMPNTTHMTAMFDSCTNLRQLTLGVRFSAGKAAYVEDLFRGCESLTTLDLSMLDLARAKYTDRMFDSMMSLEALHTPHGVRVDIKLPEGSWQTSTGQVITDGYLPKNQNESMKLTQQMHLEVKKTITNYHCGDVLDLSDLTVEWCNATGSIKKRQTDYTTNASSIDMNTEGTKELVVTCKGMTASIKITVKDLIVMDRIVLRDAKTVYLPGEKPSLEGVWLYCYQGDDLKLMTKNYVSNIDQIDTSTPGIKKVKIQSEDMQGEADLFVMEPFESDDIAHKQYDTFAYKVDKDGNLTMMGSMPRVKKADWNASESMRDSIKTAKIIIRGADDFTELLSECRNLERVDFSETETSQVKYFLCMLKGCEKLKSIDLSGFDTSHAVSFQWMFHGCKSLKSLDLSSFDTRKCLNMDGMFQDCAALENLNLSSFDTSSVLYMSDMFNGCASMTSVPCGGFHTSNVKYMTRMFANCSKLSTLNLNHFDTQKVINTSEMFKACNELTSLNLSKFDTQNVTNMSEMFYKCSRLASLDLSDFDTRKVKNMSLMFGDCACLESLDLNRRRAAKQKKARPMKRAVKWRVRQTKRAVMRKKVHPARRAAVMWSILLTQTRNGRIYRV